MTPERWQRVEQLYHAAVELAADQRLDFLVQACAGDQALRRDVEELLKAHAEAEGFMAAPAMDIAAKAISAELSALVGKQVSHYEVLSLLGAGGMGEVYLARDRRLDRTVALKILPPHAAADADRTQRFELEAKAASALNHPNVATIYDVGRADGSSFIAMEYVEGQTLAAKIDGRPLAPDQVVEIGIQVADALTEAHAKGITHRDIKPANIVITPRGLVKVLDFGLAKMKRAEGEGGNTNIATLAETVPGLVMGTVQYMSPEQVLGHKVDHRSDIFSLGVVLYEMATGRPPFAGTTATDTMGRVLHVEPEAIRQVNSEVPEELERIIQNCLLKDPGKRCQTASELLSDLRNLQLQRTPNAAVVQRAVPQWSSRLALAALAIAVLVIGVAGFLIVWNREPAADQAVESVAVLPFVNAGADPEMEYLADGITESIINNLSQLSELRVMSRAIVFRYKGQEVDPQAVGNELKVQAVLAGRVLTRGDQLSISIELIDTRDNRQLWGEQYNRKLSDVLQMQTDISRQVSDRLRLRLTGQEPEQWAKHPTENTEAYQLYLRGRFYANKLTEDGLRKALDYFQQAVDMDPNYARAYVGLADAHIMIGAEYSAPMENMPKARAHAMKALELDKTLAEAHSSLGVIHLVYDWDWAAAAEELRHNLSISPHAVEAFSCSLHYADPIGRNDEAIAAIKRALVSDPFSLPANLELGCASYFGRQYDQAIKHLRETLMMYPDHPGAAFLLGRAYGQKSMYPEAITELIKAKPLSGDWPPIVAELGYAYASSAKKAEAQKMLEELRQQSAGRYVDPYLMAVVHIGMGDKVQTLAELERAYTQRSGWLPWLRAEPKWDVLHSDPRFIDLMRRVGLKP